MRNKKGNHMEFLNLLSQYRTPAGDIIFQGITYLAQEVFVIAVICWLFWCSNKRLAYTLGFVYFFSGLLVQGLKITFRIPRPWVLDPNFTAVESAVPGATGYSFPSGHTQSITALFGTFAFYAKKPWRKAGCIAIILLVGFSRMYLGCHTPLDVCTSWLATFVVSYAIFRLVYIKGYYIGREAFFSILTAAIVFILCTYSLFLYLNGSIDISYTQDCIKACGAGSAFALGFYVENKFIRFSPPVSAKSKLARMAAGLSVAFIIQEGLKPLIGSSLLASFSRYFLVMCWILVIYPFLFTRKVK